MSESFVSKPAVAGEKAQTLEPVQAFAEEADLGRWTRRLVLFLRVMAAVSMLKGLYHWAKVCGIGVEPDQLFALHSIAWQITTIFFAVIDLVAAVGLWLAATWGAVIWLMSVGSMLAVEIFFPQVFGAALPVSLVEVCLLALYLWLALKSAQEQVP